MEKWIEDHWRIFSAFILFMSVGWIFATAGLWGKGDGKTQTAAAVGFIAPDFHLTALSGDTYQLSEFRGKVILINVWTSWCPPCKNEMPDIEKVYVDFKDRGFEVLAVNSTNQDNKSAVTEFSTQLGLTFPVLLDLDGQITREYRVFSLPTSFLVDPAGIIRNIWIGQIPQALLRSQVQKNLVLDQP
jgi:peroxiredoxin